MEHTLAEQWIPRRRIGKGPGQPPQLACTGRLQGRATQVETEHKRRGCAAAKTWRVGWQACREEEAARTCCLSHAEHKSCDEEVQSRGCAAAKTWRVGWQVCREAEHKRQGNTLAEQWIPRRHIGKGPG